LSKRVRTDGVVDIKDQCDRADVAFFFKQWGGTNKKKAGRRLKGRVYSEMPELPWRLGESQNSVGDLAQPKSPVTSH